MNSEQSTHWAQPNKPEVFPMTFAAAPPLPTFAAPPPPPPTLPQQAQPQPSFAAPPQSPSLLQTWQPAPPPPPFLTNPSANANININANTNASGSSSSNGVGGLEKSVTDFQSNYNKVLSESTVPSTSSSSRGGEVNKSEAELPTGRGGAGGAGGSGMYDQYAFSNERGGEQAIPVEDYGYHVPPPKKPSPPPAPVPTISARMPRRAHRKSYANENPDTSDSSAEEDEEEEEVTTTSSKVTKKGVLGNRKPPVASTSSASKPTTSTAEGFRPPPPSTSSASKPTGQLGGLGGPSNGGGSGNKAAGGYQAYSFDYKPNYDASTGIPKGAAAAYATESEEEEEVEEEEIDEDDSDEEFIESTPPPKKKRGSTAAAAAKAKRASGVNKRRASALDATPKASTSKPKVITGPYMTADGVPIKRTEIVAVEDDPSIKPYGCYYPSCLNLMEKARLKGGRELEMKEIEKNSFRTIRELREHCGVHKRKGESVSDTPYRCALDPCGKTFKSLAGLRWHFQNASANGHFFVSTEEGEDRPSKKFKACVTSSGRVEKCPVKNCAKAFKQAAGLAYHLAHAPNHVITENMLVGYSITLTSKTKWWYNKLGKVMKSTDGLQYDAPDYGSDEDGEGEEEDAEGEDDEELEAEEEELEKEEEEEEDQDADGEVEELDSIVVASTKTTIVKPTTPSTKEGKGKEVEAIKSGGKGRTIGRTIGNGNSNATASGSGTTSTTTTTTTTRHVPRTMQTKPRPGDYKVGGTGLGAMLGNAGSDDSEDSDYQMEEQEGEEHDDDDEEEEE